MLEIQTIYYLLRNYDKDLFEKYLINVVSKFS